MMPLSSLISSKKKSDDGNKNKNSFEQRPKQIEGREERSE
jgi:hypothetical protein